MMGMGRSELSDIERIHVQRTKICLRCVQIQAHDALLFPLGYVAISKALTRSPCDSNPYSENRFSHWSYLFFWISSNQFPYWHFVFLALLAFASVFDRRFSNLCDTRQLHLLVEGREDSQLEPLYEDLAMGPIVWPIEELGAWWTRVINKFFYTRPCFHKAPAFRCRALAVLAVSCCSLSMQPGLQTPTLCEWWWWTALEKLIMYSNRRVALQVSQLATLRYKF